MSYHLTAGRRAGFQVKAAPLTLAVNSNACGQRLRLSLSALLAGEIGWEPGDRVALAIGAEADLGRVRLYLSDLGNVLRHRSEHGSRLVIWFGCTGFAGWPLTQPTVEAAHLIEDADQLSRLALTVTLPWPQSLHLVHSEGAAA